MEELNKLENQVQNILMGFCELVESIKSDQPSERTQDLSKELSDQFRDVEVKVQNSDLLAANTDLLQNQNLILERNLQDAYEEKKKLEEKIQKIKNSFEDSSE